MAVKRNPKIGNFTFTQSKVDSCANYEAFKKMYESGAYLDAAGKPVANQEELLKKAWAILKPGEAAKKVEDPKNK